ARAAATGGPPAQRTESAASTARPGGSPRYRAAARASPRRRTPRSTAPARTARRTPPASAVTGGRYNPATDTIIAPNWHRSEPAARLAYIGGLTPSFSAVTRAAVKLPSGFFNAK